jgi:hypothetical protein
LLNDRPNRSVLFGGNSVISEVPQVDRKVMSALGFHLHRGGPWGGTAQSLVGGEPTWIDVVREYEEGPAAPLDKGSDSASESESKKHEREISKHVVLPFQQKNSG